MGFVIDGSLDRHIAALALLATLALGGLGGAGLLYSLITGRFTRARRFLLASTGLGTVYVLVMLGFALTSEERSLDPGMEKHLCEVDCHLAYSIERVEPVAAPATRFKRVILVVRVHFDEQTISSSRAGDVPVRPNSRIVLLEDGGGNRYRPRNEAQLFEARGTEPPLLRRPLKPGEKVYVSILFELPRDQSPEKLLISGGDEITRVLIGHENSPLHKKTYLSLPPPEPGGTQAQNRSRAPTRAPRPADSINGPNPAS